MTGALPVRWRSTVAPMIGAPVPSRRVALNVAGSPALPCAGAVRVSVAGGGTSATASVGETSATRQASRRRGRASEPSEAVRDPASGAGGGVRGVMVVSEVAPVPHPSGRNGLTLNRCVPTA